jgi:hypothetical protein
VKLDTLRDTKPETLRPADELVGDAEAEEASPAGE